MSEEDRKPPKEKQPGGAASAKEAEDLDELEQLIDGARQAVMPLVKQELAGESVGEEILSFRMRLRK